MRGRRTNPDSGSVVSSDNGPLQTLVFEEILRSAKQTVTELAQLKPICRTIFTSGFDWRDREPP